MLDEADINAKPEVIAKPPSGFDLFWDRAFRLATLSVAWLVVLLLGLILYQIGKTALPAIGQYGIGFLTTSTWDPNTETFGILPSIWGTLYSSLLALILAGVLGVAVAVFLTQDFLPKSLAWLFKNIVDLLAAIPSVVYGLWGIFVVIPFLKTPMEWAYENFGWFPFFSTSPTGPGMLPASLVLAIMILPTVTAVARDALVAVPSKLKEAAFGLGATRWEVILKVILPTSATGVFGALVLGFGRALGETMALAMLINSQNKISLSLFSPGNTLAALMANNFPEADDVQVGALMYAALVLLAITLLVNVAGTFIMRRALKEK